ncbi:MULTISPECIES: DUF680 domain-containing protein [unclassified Mesorhizobium]|uniref:DUF680 domain-containing protein n=1 Tax=unclassified Mesorhizobium TaxID=325217 RepID=UPI00112EABBF|nr:MULTISPECIES: DUF680 domain-containing protein [unclassified Mesorhizobium]MBZ9742429.1 DUF680 domain-containing protein [Mesorhizobium sp. CO1-1-4]MBZ9802362.1 DUF680 domain-containing protein [Mesorhizobium sp. ES1-6]MBZ9997702.1 DUF680 domain-containing protein [Mesorhizobium sp. BH1-1-4]TPL93298.1 DUF680 domain-containing protein [Mesorhizobium sp. B2-3-12]
MTKIALTAAALLIAASTAFAGSDKFGSDNASQPAVASTDNTVTNSIRKSEATNQKPVVQGSNRDLFGSR